MASRKSAPKSTARKATKPEKKSATKRKPVAAKTERAASGATATKSKTARSAPPSKSRRAKATDAKPRDAKKPTKAVAPSPESSKTTPRAGGKAVAKKAATPGSPTSPSAPAKRAGKGAAKAAEASKSVAAPARKRSASAGPPRTVAVTVGSEIVSKLGRKWNCFQCGASFYDLNRPEPLCPKCGADQRQRPKVTASTPAHPPAPRKQPRPMAPLLDDEDDGTVRYDEEFDLGVRTDIDDAEQDLFPTGDVEEDDVFGADEE